MGEGFPMSDSSAMRNMEESSQEDCMPFLLDDDSSGPEGSPSFSRRRPSMKSTYGFSLDTKADRREASPSTSFRYGNATRKENSSLRLDSHGPSVRNLSDHLGSVDQKPVNAHSRGGMLLLCCLSFLYTVSTSKHVLINHEVFISCFHPQLGIHWT